MKKILLPLVILLVGAVLALLLVRSRAEVDKVVQAAPPPVTRVIEVQPIEVRLDVASQGTVSPRTEADLVSEVAGTIVRVSPNFQPGSFFRRGEVLLELDRRDYELNVASAEAQISQARVALEREQAEAEVAREEWQELGSGDPGPLVLREPQLQEARARIAAAEAALAKAELDLSRTTIKSPFAGRLRAKRVDLGEFVNRGSPLATIYSVDHAEIHLPVPDSELAFLDVELGTAARGRSPAVELRANFAGATETWTGNIVRVGGEIDPRTRMVPLIAQVARPFSSENGPPLSVGLFVEAEIEGRTVSGVYAIPRSAFRGRDTLLVVDDDNRIRPRQVGVLRSGDERVVVDRGLDAGDRVCLLPLESLVEGTLVDPRIVTEAPTEEPSREAPVSLDTGSAVETSA